MKPMVLLDIIYLELNNGTVGEKYSNNRFLVLVFFLPNIITIKTFQLKALTRNVGRPTIKKARAPNVTWILRFRPWTKLCEFNIVFLVVVLGLFVVVV